MPDLLIARIASKQHDVIAIAQLLAAGLTPAGQSSAASRPAVCTGFTEEYLPSALQPSPGKAARMAAVVVWRRGRRPQPRERRSALVDLAHTAFAGPRHCPRNGGRRQRKGIVLHRSTTLTPADVTIRRWGIPVTTYARTRATWVTAPSPPAATSSAPFLRICRRHGVPMPQVNAQVGPFTVDFLWREERLIVEVDGWKYHSSRVLGSSPTVLATANSPARDRGSPIR